jgi:DNA-nicking Smr family endonuclease
MFDDTLDFHNFGLLEPNQIKYYFENFIDNSIIQGNKYLLIITGKGEGQKSPHGMVKNNVKQLLHKSKKVLKYREAEEQWGGSGAFEVWLKSC